MLHVKVIVPIDLSVEDIRVLFRVLADGSLQALSVSRALDVNLEVQVSDLLFTGIELLRTLLLFLSLHAL